jgi:hypothetical protein
MIPSYSRNCHSNSMLQRTMRVRSTTLRKIGMLSGAKMARQ